MKVDQKRIKPRLRACDICHLRKVKCDRSVPACSNCSKHSVPCTYFIATGKKPARRNTLKKLKIDVGKSFPGSSIESPLKESQDCGFQSEQPPVVLLSQQPVTSSASSDFYAFSQNSASLIRKNYHFGAFDINLGNQSATENNSMSMTFTPITKVNSLKVLANTLLQLICSSDSRSHIAFDNTGNSNYIGNSPAGFLLSNDCGSLLKIIGKDYAGSFNTINAYRNNCKKPCDYANLDDPHLISGLKFSESRSKELYFKISNINSQITVELIEQLVALFFTYSNPYQMAVHRESFYSQFYGNKTHTDSFLALLNAICLTGAGHFPHKAVTPILSRIFSYRVQFFLKKSYYKRDLNSLTTLSIISQFITTHYDEFMQRGWYYSMLAYRKAIDMGLNRECSMMNKKDREIRRRIWWNMYINDRQYSFCVGMQKTLQEYNCNLKLPTYDPEIDYFESKNPQIPQISQYTFPENELSISFFKSYIIYCHLLGAAAVIKEQFKSFKNSHMNPIDVNVEITQERPRCDFELIDGFVEFEGYKKQLKRFLLLEDKFHEWYSELPPFLHINKRPDWITIPYGKEPFTAILHLYYFSVLIEFNMQHIRSEHFKTLDYDWILGLRDGIKLEDFKNCNALTKCIISAYFGSQIIKSMGQNFVVDSPAYKWWCVFNFIMIHIKMIEHIRSSDRVHGQSCFMDTSHSFLVYLYNMLHEGGIRWAVVRDVDVLVKSLLYNTGIAI